MKYFNVPNAAWAALLTVLTTWLTQFFPDWWVTGLIVAGGAAGLKFLEVLAKGQEFVPDTPTLTELDPTTGAPIAQGAPMPDGQYKAVTEVPRSVLGRVLFG